MLLRTVLDRLDNAQSQGDALGDALSATAGCSGYGGSGTQAVGVRGQDANCIARALGMSVSARTKRMSDKGGCWPLLQTLFPCPSLMLPPSPASLATGPTFNATRPVDFLGPSLARPARHLR